MADGAVAKGKVIAAGGTRSLADLLNSPGQFLEFEAYGGDSAFIAKSRIAEIKPLGVPKGINLRARLAGNEPLNPMRCWASLRTPRQNRSARPT